MDAMMNMAFVCFAALLCIWLDSLRLYKSKELGNECTKGFRRIECQPLKTPFLCHETAINSQRDFATNMISMKDAGGFCEGLSPFGKCQTEL
jgi:hypothetical protein